MVRFSRVGLAAVPMCHPQVIRSRQRMRHDGGNAGKSQDHREGLRPLPLKSMEVVFSTSSITRSRCASPIRAALDARLVVGSDETHSVFDQLQADPAAPGIKNLEQEIAKLRTLRALRNVPPEALAAVPAPVLHLLTRRAANERAVNMLAHPAAIRYALLACFIHQRTMEVIDHVVRMMLEIIRRIDTQTDKHLQKELCRDIKRVAGKVQLLFRVAEAVVEEPEGTIREVLFPRVQEETFHDLAAEAQASGAQYRSWYHYVMRQKYGHHYRQMLPLVLEHLTFRSDNRFQPVIEALTVIKQYLNTKGPYFPEEETVPLDGVVLPSWRDTVLEAHEGEGPDQPAIL